MLYIYTLLSCYLRVLTTGVVVFFESSVSLSEIESFSVKRNAYMSITVITDQGDLTLCFSNVPASNVGQVTHWRFRGFLSLWASVLVRFTRYY
jgi:hypothetical protein